MASYEGHENMVVTRHPMVYSLLRKQHIQFYSMYSEQGSPHPSSEQSHTVKCLFYLCFTNFNFKKRLNPVYIILPPQCTEVQCRAVQCSAVQCSTEMCSVIQLSVFCAQTVSMIPSDAIWTRLSKFHKNHKHRLCKMLRAWVTFSTEHTFFQGVQTFSLEICLCKTITFRMSVLDPIVLNCTLSTILHTTLVLWPGTAK